MSLHQAHILLNNRVAGLTIPFTNTCRMFEFIILLFKLNTILRKCSPKDGKFSFTKITEALLYFGKLSNLLSPMLEAIFSFFINVTVLSNHLEGHYIVAQ